MKKRMLSLFMCFVLCLSLCPVGALAEGGEDAAHEHDHAHEAEVIAEAPAAEESAPVEPEATPESEPESEPETPAEAPAEEPAEEPAAESTPEPTAEPEPESEAEPEEEPVDEAVAAVQALIDALPSADAVSAEDYDAVQTAYDAYNALDESQRALVVGAEVFEALFAWFNEQTETLDETECTDGKHTPGTDGVTCSVCGAALVAHRTYVIPEGYGNPGTVNQYYESLYMSFRDSSFPVTVTLLNDVADIGSFELGPDSHTVTFDLNGHKLGKTTSDSRLVIRLYNGNDKLTIKDSSENKTGEITSSVENAQSATVEVDAGSLTVEGGTIDELKVSGGTVTVKGGTIADLTHTDGTLTLSGGEFGKLCAEIDADEQPEAVFEGFLADGCGYSNSNLQSPGSDNVWYLENVSVVSEGESGGGDGGEESGGGEDPGVDPEPCDHSKYVEGEGSCPDCGCAIVAKIGSTYYTRDELYGEVYAATGSTAVTLVESNVSVSLDALSGATVTLDLNGKESVYLDLNPAGGGAAIAVTGEGKVSTLTVNAGSASLMGGEYAEIRVNNGITLAELLGTGRAYQYTSGDNSGTCVKLNDLTGDTLENVKVVSCGHSSSGSTCDYCGTASNAVARVTFNGESADYATFDAAEDALTEASTVANTTVTLLADATRKVSIPSTSYICQSFTLDLNGHSLKTVKEEDNSSTYTLVDSTMVIQGGGTVERLEVNVNTTYVGAVTAKNVTLGKATVQPNATLNLENTAVTGTLSVVGSGALTVTGSGKVGELNVASGNSVTLRGGTFEKIVRPKDNAPAFTKLLGAGYAYSNESGKIELTKLTTTTETTGEGENATTQEVLADVSVVACTSHGWNEDTGRCDYCDAACTHSWGTDGKCATCGAGKVASITRDGTTTYYASLADAFAAAREVKTDNETGERLNEPDTIKMESDTTVPTKHDGENCTLDLNGHTIAELEFDCQVTTAPVITVTDSSAAGTGSVTKLTRTGYDHLDLQAGTYGTITANGILEVLKLLGEGYAYQYTADSSYVTISGLVAADAGAYEKTTCTLQNVKVAAHPTEQKAYATTVEGYSMYMCDYCGEWYTAAYNSKEDGGYAEYYTSFADAMAARGDDTSENRRLYLLQSDSEAITLEWGNLYLDLNGCDFDDTITVTGGALYLYDSGKGTLTGTDGNGQTVSKAIYGEAKKIILTGNDSGSGGVIVYAAHVDTLEISGGQLVVEAYTESDYNGKLTTNDTDAAVKSLVVSNLDACDIGLSVGSYGSITVKGTTAPDFTALLGTYAVFTDSDDNVINPNKKYTAVDGGYKLSSVKVSSDGTHTHDFTSATSLGACSCGCSAEAYTTSDSKTTYYATVDDAITALNGSLNFQEITLLKNVSTAGRANVDKETEVTLVLNGYTISELSSYSKLSLTVYDSPSGTGGTIKKVVMSGGTLTTQNVTIENCALSGWGVTLTLCDGTVLKGAFPVAESGMTTGTVALGNGCTTKTDADAGTITVTKTAATADTAAAQIGDTYYYTWNDAMIALSMMSDTAGVTLKLLKPVTEPDGTVDGYVEGIWATNNTLSRPVTIDLNGNSLVLTNGSENGTIRSTAEVEIKNSGSSAGSLSATLSATLMVKGGTLSVTGDVSISYLWVTDGSASLSGGRFGTVQVWNGRLSALLAEGYVFAGKADPTAGDYTAVKKAGEATSFSDVKVIAHASHSWTDGKCPCGETCSHDWTNKDGKCATCGTLCGHADVNADNKCTVCGVEFVAQVGDTLYTTVDEAVAAASDDTVTLLTDVTAAAEISINSKTITIDLNGHTLTTYNEPKTDFDPDTETEITYQNYLSIIVVTGGHLTLQNGTVVGDVSIQQGRADNSLALNSVTVKANNASDSAGILRYFNFGEDTTSTLTISGSSSVKTLSLPMTDKLTATLGAGTSYGEIRFDSQDYSGRVPADLLPSGCAFKTTGGSYITLPTNTTTSLTNVSVAECTEHSVVNGACQYCGGTFDAKIGDTLYATVSAAAAAAADGSTIVLLGNVTGSVSLETNEKSLTLDLAGYEMTSVNAVGIGTCHLTITDSSENKTGKITALTAGEHVKLTGGSYGSITKGDNVGVKELPATGYVFYGADGNLVRPYNGQGTISDVKIGLCTNHSWVDYYEGGKYCEYCGVVCQHPAYENGACKTCGLACAHGDVNAAEHKCTTCGSLLPYQVGEQSFRTLQEAIYAAARAGGNTVIDLVCSSTDANETAGTQGQHTVILDLNGFTYAGTLTANGIREEGALTVADSSADDTGKLHKLVLLESNGTIAPVYIYGGSYDVIECTVHTADGTEVDAYRAKMADVLYSTNCRWVYLGATGDTQAHYSERTSRIQANENTSDNTALLTFGAYKAFVCAEHNWTKADGVCDWCGTVCEHTNVDADGKCPTCGLQFAAKFVWDDENKSVGYAKADEMAEWMVRCLADGTTDVTLLTDVTVNYGIDRKINLNLNGHTLTYSGDLLIEADCTVKGGGKIAASSVKVQKGTLTVEGNTEFPALSVENQDNTNNSGKAVLKDGTYEKLTVSGNGTAALSGGTFESITSNGSSANAVQLKAMLAEGYAWKSIKHTGMEGEADVVSFATPETMANLLITYNDNYAGVDSYTYTVAKCTSHLNANGACAYCAQALLAKVTYGGTTVYATDAEAVTAALTTAGNTQVTLKLLQNWTLAGEMACDNNVELDLNGKSFNGNWKQTGGKLTVTSSASSAVDSGTVYSLTIGANAEAELSAGVYNTISVTGGGNVGSLLKENYGFYSASSGTWYESGCTETTLANVTVREIPITGVTIAAADNATGMTYGDTLGFTATVTTADSSAGSNITYLWYYQKSGDNTYNEFTGTATAAFGKSGESKLDAGSYEVWCVAKYDSGISYTKASARTTVTIAPKELTAADVTLSSETATYHPGVTQSTTVTVTDGETELTWTEDFSTNLGGITEKEVNAGAYTIKVTGKGNYTGEVTKTWTIERRVIKPEITTTKEKDKITLDVKKFYDGTTNYNGTGMQVYLDQVGGQPTGTNVWGASANEVAILGTFDNANVGENVPVTVTITLKDKNFVFEGGSNTATVTTTGTIRKDYVSSPAVPLTVYNNRAHTYTVDLAQYLPALGEGKDYGDVTYTIDTDGTWNSEYGTATLEGSTLKIEVPNDASAADGADLGTVKVNVSSTNYNDFSINVVCTAAAKAKPVGTPTLNTYAITYGQPLSAITFTASNLYDPLDSAVVNGTFSWVNGDTVLNAGANQEAEWKFTPESGSIYAEVTGIVKIGVERAKVTVNEQPAGKTGLVYNGQPQELFDCGDVQNGTLKFSTDSNSWTENIPTGTAAGQYKFYWMVEPNSNYTTTGTTVEGHGQVSVTIGAKPLTADMIVVPEQTYTGLPQTPMPEVTDGTALVYNVDYSVTVTEQENAGTYTLTVTGMGNYTGEVTKTWKIKPQQVGDLKVGLVGDQGYDYPTYPYTGDEIKPEIYLYVEGTGGVDLPEGSYTVTYANNVNVGTQNAVPSVTVTLTDTKNMVAGNYQFSNTEATVQFVITPAEITSVTVAGAYYYTGEEQSATICLTAKSDNKFFDLSDLVEGRDYTISGNEQTDADTYEIELVGKGNFTNAESLTMPEWTIEPRDARLEINATGREYDGTTAVEYTASICADDVIEGDDVSPTGGSVVANSPNAGRQSLTVTGFTLTGEDAANYNLKLYDSYGVTISQKALTIGQNCTVTPAEKWTYTGSPITPKFAVTCTLGGNAVELVEGTDYSISVTPNTDTGIDAGKHKAYINGIAGGNYSFTGGPVEWTIDRAALTDVAVSMAGYAYGGTVSTPSVTGNRSGGSVTYEYSADGENWTTWTADTVLNAGDYFLRATVAETANYNGATTAAVSFTVAKSNVSFTNDPEAKGEIIYTGAPQELIAAGSVAAGHSVPDSVFYYRLGTDGAWTTDASEIKGTNVGRYEVYWYATGGRNYVDCGSAEEPNITNVQIKARDIQNAVIALDEDEKTYTGEAQSQSVQSVQLDGTTLTPDTDYTVGGELSGTNAKTYTVTVIGVGNYTGTATKTWVINQLTPVIKDAKANVTFGDAVDGSAIESEWTALGRFEWVAESYGDVGTRVLTANFIPTDAENYANAYAVPVTVTVAQAAAPTLTNVAHSRHFDSARIDTISLANVGIPADAGSVALAIDGDVDECVQVAIEDMELDVALVGLTAEDVGRTITIPVVVQSQNYADATVNVEIKITKKAVPTVEVDHDDFKKTYDGEHIEPKGEAHIDGKPVPGYWHWERADDQPHDEAPRGDHDIAPMMLGMDDYGIAPMALSMDDYGIAPMALGVADLGVDLWGAVANGSAVNPVNAADSGVWVLVFTPEDTDNYEVVRTNVTVVIEKRSVTVKSEDITRDYNGAQLTNGTTNIKTDNMVEGESFDIRFTGSQTKIGSSDNSFVVSDGTADMGNYDITIEPGTLRVAVPSDTGAAVKDVTKETVTSQDSETVAETLAVVEEYLKMDPTPEEKETLLALKSELEGVNKQLEKAADAKADDAITSVDKIDSSNVKPEDKTTLTEAKDAIEKALEDFGGNYTAEEKKELTEKLGQIESALETIEKEQTETKPDEDDKNDRSDKENKPAVNTGDTSTPVLWIVIIVVCVGAVVVLLVARKKKK